MGTDVIGRLVTRKRRGSAARTMRQRHIDCAGAKKSGAIFWASQNLSLVRDSTGAPSGLICSLTDTFDAHRGRARITC